MLPLREQPCKPRSRNHSRPAGLECATADPTLSSRKQVGLGLGCLALAWQARLTLPSLGCGRGQCFQVPTAPTSTSPGNHPREFDNCWSVAQGEDLACSHPPSTWVPLLRRRSAGGTTASLDRPRAWVSSRLEDWLEGLDPVCRGGGPLGSMTPLTAPEGICTQVLICDPPRPL